MPGYVIPVTDYKRRRDVYFRKSRRREWHSYWPFPGPPASDEQFEARGVNILATSSGHRFFELGGGNDAGGDFHVIKQVLDETVSPVEFARSPEDLDSGAHVSGPVFARYAAPTPAMFPAAQFSSPSELRAAGTHAIAAVEPTKPYVSFATEVGELTQDGLPDIPGTAAWKEGTRVARSAGKEYLNYQFGWKPLVDDIRKFARTVKDVDSLRQKYARGSGKRLHRSYHFPVGNSIEVEELGANAPQPLLPTNFYRNAFGPLTLTTRVERNRWFEGVFTYHLPELGVSKMQDYDRYLAEADKLWGVRLSPEVLWNLAPWSWAVDWGTNIGDYIHNLTAFGHGLVMPYAYMMETVTVEELWTLEGIEFSAYPDQTFTLRQSFKTISKMRVRADPFGFEAGGILTPYRAAIVAALGLTHT